MAKFKLFDVVCIKSATPVFVAKHYLPGQPYRIVEVVDVECGTRYKVDLHATYYQSPNGDHLMLSNSRFAIGDDVFFKIGKDIFRRGNIRYYEPSRRKYQVISDGRYYFVQPHNMVLR